MVVAVLASGQHCPLVIWGTDILNLRDECCGVRASGGSQGVHLLMLQRVMELLGVLEARLGGSAAQGRAGAD